MSAGYSKALTKKQADQFKMKLAVGLVTHGKIQPAVFFHDTFLVAEGFEALSSMVGTHAAVSHTAEAHL